MFLKVSCLLLLLAHVSGQCYRTTDALNLRSGPSRTNGAITTIASGQTVSRIGTTQPWADGYTWYNINYNGAIGWAVNQYLTPTTCPSSPPPVPPPPAGGSCTFNRSPNFQAASTAPLQKSDIVAAARGLGVEPAAVKAVTDVEAGGNGFFTDGRPKILFENYWFWKLTSGRFGTCNDLSCDHWDRTWYRGGPAEYDRLLGAYAKDQNAALQSASWGAFQIMGFNYNSVGYATIDAFIADMLCGSAGHMRAFLGFVRNKGLITQLKNKDWAGFAYRYNGAGYAANNYDGKMAAAYANAVAAGYNNFMEVDDNDQTLLFLTAKHSSHLPIAVVATVVVALAVVVVAAIVISIRRRRVTPDWDPLIQESELTVV